MSWACVGVAVDLVGWQCAAPQSTCASERRYLAFLTHGFFAPPGRRLAVTALAPVAAICVLYGYFTGTRLRSSPKSTQAAVAYDLKKWLDFLASSRKTPAEASHLGPRSWSAAPPSPPAR